ncbi:MAG: L,D-transpeptidase family protein [Hyphomicrobiales bacterium]|nr:L,D-transpeptidase family protein [Hyphomicrobiales bacterium]
MANRFITARSIGTIRRRSATNATVAVAVALTAPLMAPAASGAATQWTPKRVAETTAPREAGAPIMAIVSLKRQQVTVYDADGWIRRAPVSTGMTGRETPAGIFSIVEKDKDHHSNLYDDASMPNMERLTWSGIALHGGPLPGHAASHGCIRMPYGFAATLFDSARIGMRVIIAPDDAKPEKFSNPALLVGNAQAAADARTHAETLAREAADAVKLAGQAKDSANAAARAAAPAAGSVRKLQALKSEADAAVAYAEKLLAGAKTEQATSRAEDLRQKATAKAAYLAISLDSAKAEAKTKLDAAKAARDDAAAAKTKMTEAAKAAHDAKLATEPVSIFISRATQRLYVRRAFTATLDVPVTIRDPGKPIGTHVFTAVARTDDGGLRWTAVTIDGGDNAKDALDRVTMPKEILDRVGPTALPRSSIIISDEPLNGETNYHTEFVVVLNNYPQGGLLMRQHPQDDRVAEDDRDDDRPGGGFFGFQPWGSWNSFVRQRSGRTYYMRQW